MKFALLVLSFFLICGCKSAKTVDEKDEMIIAVTVEGETIEWLLNLGPEAAKSCFLSGDVRRGTSQNIETQEIMSIAYVRSDDSIIIESPSGICDAGVEAELTLVNGLYEGDLRERSFYGYEVIGAVREVRP